MLRRIMYRYTRSPLINTWHLKSLLGCAALFATLSAPALGFSETPLTPNPAAHLSGKSTRLTKSGVAQVGKPLPFFSGWLTTGRVLNLSRLLKKKKTRYVVTMCASWCEPCFEGLKAISNAKTLFQDKNIEVVIYVADSEIEAKKIHEQFKFDWAHVLIDEFKSHARKLSSGKHQKKKGTLELPRTFVLNQKGEVEMIIGQEGSDYIQLLLGSGG